jgi:hypothetical protein
MFLNSHFEDEIEQRVLWCPYTQKNVPRVYSRVNLWTNVGGIFEEYILTLKGRN